MRPRRAGLLGRGGFTLTEVLVVTAVMGIVFAGVLGGLQIGIASSRVGNGRAEAQSAARIGLDRIMRDIRSAGVNPTGNAFPSAPTPTPVVSTAATNQIVLNSDLNASGAATAPGAGVCDPAIDSEVVQYRVVNSELRRSVSPANATCEAAIIGGVQSLTFQYLDATGAAVVGNLPATNMNIATVVVTLTVTAEQVTGSQTGAIVVTMTDQARIRNR